eukprot:415801_1
MSSNSSVIWNKQTLSMPLVTNIMDENKFIDCIKPLRYMFYPIAIFNLSTDHKPHILLKIWSYIFALSLFFICTYSMNPKTDDWLKHVDERNNKIQSIVLRICFVSHNLVAIASYAFLRWYFLPKQKLQYLLKELYKYIEQTATATNNDATEYLQIYYTTIYKYSKYLCILCYVLQFSTIAIWLIIASSVSSNIISFNTVWLFSWQVYWPIFSVAVIFLM